jgi:hypothetical protein
MLYVPDALHEWGFEDLAHLDSLYHR